MSALTNPRGLDFREGWRTYGALVAPSNMQGTEPLIAQAREWAKRQNLEVDSIVVVPIGAGGWRKVRVVGRPLVAGRTIGNRLSAAIE